MGLDYGYTCPDIDREIKSVKADFYSSIQDILETYNGQELSEQEIKDISEGLSDDLYRDVETSFEECRSTNDDMRKQAEYQIDELEKRIENLEWQLDDMTNEISSKDQEIESLNEELSTI